MRQLYGRPYFMGNPKIMIVFNNLQAGIIISDYSP
jgi:hypothetical protein